MSSWMHRDQQAAIPEWPSQGLPRVFADCWDEKGFSEEQTHIQTQAPQFFFMLQRLPELNTLTTRRCSTLLWIRRGNKMYSSPLRGGHIRKNKPEGKLSAKEGDTFKKGIIKQWTRKIRKQETVACTEQVIRAVFSVIVWPKVSGHSVEIVWLKPLLDSMYS